MPDLRALSDEALASNRKLSENYRTLLREYDRVVGERDRLLAAAEEIVEEIEDCVYAMATRQLSEGECIDAIVAVKTGFRSLVAEIKEGK